MGETKEWTTEEKAKFDEALTTIINTPAPVITPADEWELWFEFNPPSPSITKTRRETKYTKSINKYFITLTAGPPKPNIYMKAIGRIIRQKRLKIVDGFGVIELTKDKRPHAHIYIECTRYVCKSDITRIWKESFIDIKNVKTDNGIKKYMHKDENNEELIQFLKKHSCPRIDLLNGD